MENAGQSAACRWSARLLLRFDKRWCIFSCRSEREDRNPGMLTDIIFRLRSLLRRKRVEAELDNELRFHFEQEVEKHVRSGLAHDEAVRLARLALAGMDQ